MMKITSDDEDNERNQTERSRLRFILRNAQRVACSDCDGARDAMTAAKHVRSGEACPQRQRPAQTKQVTVRG